jgi:peptidoglycan/LPS O-acetylase OafA/YrhL
VSGATGRVDYLDGIRAVAITAVLALHWLSWHVPLFRGGSIGVDVFFVLSGFIITTVLWRTGGDAPLLRSWASFLRRRLLRLYPALVGLVAGGLMLYAVAPWAPLGPLEVLRRGVFVLGQGTALWAASTDGVLWLPALHPFGQTWSLAIEWYFYVLWPLVVLLALARRRRARTLAVGSFAAAALLYLGSLPLSTAWFYFGPTARFAELLVGAGVALVLSTGRRPRLSARASSVISAVALAAICTYTLLAPPASSPWYRFVGVPLAVTGTVALVVAGHGATSGPVHRLLSHPLVAGLGRCSYSLYLWHLVPMLLLEDVTGSSRPVLGVVVVAATAVLTLGSYRFLETPFLRSRGSVLAPSREDSPAGAAVRTPRSTRASSSSSAAAGVEVRPMRSATASRRGAPTQPPESTSARNSSNGR